MTREEIKEKYSMRDVLDRYGLEPNRAGFLRCPFHQGDREASLKVYPHDYHCFGCGANGDIFDFIMRMEDLSFREAFLALGGEYESVPQFQRVRRRIQFERRRREKQQREAEFQAWRCLRLGQICGLLRACDALEGVFPPLSDEWGLYHQIRQENEYKYEVLAFGAREDQEEMRRDGG